MKTSRYAPQIKVYETLESVQSEVPEEIEEYLTSVENVQSVSLENQGVRDIVVLINKEPVRLRGKQKYILVDIFDFYPLIYQNRREGQLC